ncbi:ABC transporter ATP-binding protein [Sphaerisporangium corydalis]|uniref:ABC transporter ATP-binding protein n=1 Tax=Sphaerisporangium corydalis TaxID=1441875 RepID=A0ABV9ESU0_9ACTN|nr:ABC transporter ATP-binding protein [Sphaerisporangium corydalis]
MTLRARLVVERAGFRLDVGFEVAPGEVVALLGPNGAGKTTALRALAGLTALTSGHIDLEGRALHEIPAESRPIGMVFQDYLLFPHLSALDNVAFGPRCHGASKVEARRTASAWLERVGLSAHAGSRPRRLSGGQAQRVALARALAVGPRLLLLDEPLAALDAHTRLDVRSELRRHLAGFDGATVLVTHDPLDAMVLADRLVVIENGSIVQEGTSVEVARRPRTDYVARLVGLNLYRGIATGRTVTIEATAGTTNDTTTNDTTTADMTSADTIPGVGTLSSGGGPGAGTADVEDGGVEAGGGEGVVFSVVERFDGPVFVAFPPSAVALYGTRPNGTPRNLWRARIDGVERHGDNVRVHLDGPIPVAADVTPAAVAELDLVPGKPVWVSVKATETHAYPA